MSDTVIRVENLSKKYIIGHQQQERYTALRDVIANKVKSLGSLIHPKAKVENPAFEDFWALKDVSFEIKQGDRVGIIGRNGAGKSTLLKILSRITEPTTGSIKIKGRVASLLEVGTGFHPELTGRENIFLNGAILGMGKEEIKRKFDEIVAFAEVEKFLDTPVKRYSSGMYVRLAFAVAAHLESEILIVDEVLAVGDAAFQKKCLGKMEDISGAEGRTVLFVSHNIAAIQNLCNMVAWLNGGKLIEKGIPKEIIPSYCSQGFSNKIQQTWENPKVAPGNEYVRLHHVKVESEKYNEEEIINVSSPLKIKFEYWSFLPNAELNISFVLYNQQGICVFNAISDPKIFSAGFVSAICYIPGNLLNNGIYKIRLLIVKDTSTILFCMDEALMFEVSDIERPFNWYGDWIGAVRPSFKWDFKFIDFNKSN
ncbi:ABC transporter ATP-binding protein [Nodularia sphaerocarpa]|uniref:ABC transporter ATP-binding protein n=1 Tax=Nodularia sphaerocarpa TaxID=137816 RepID=UPI001EFAA29A|nr:ABC transporter ATP-binding protein [Nodularia sphaerocarpa]MDB9375012.1 ABC transporter ATP-binding protein [Nodularia sphaerocarpa CS-585]MDB9377691.1 ABC transporter ATP-binding protein [Nodularia sphaerocarpa CS-585A2]ULP74195.1 Teichoic acids export ATP-binding protein TagH [Nodularia sphaerocarpa UHCC 0038]